MSVASVHSHSGLRAQENGQKPQTLRGNSSCLGGGVFRPGSPCSTHSGDGRRDNPVFLAWEPEKENWQTVHVEASGGTPQGERDLQPLSTQLPNWSLNHTDAKQTQSSPAKGKRSEQSTELLHKEQSLHFKSSQENDLEKKKGNTIHQWEIIESKISRT